jgi:ferrochelatase
VSAARAPLGVLLSNLGTPAAPTPRAVRRYLREFLWDPSVVDADRVLWWLVLHGLVLPFRSGQSARLYRRVWTPEGSPLLVHGRRLAAALQEELGRDHAVVLAMRYGEPSLAAGLAELRRRGARRALVVPLFPQYSRTTTGSIEARLARISRAEGAPALDVLGSFHLDPGYLACVAARVRATAPGLASAGEPPHLVLSFHGIPVRYAEAGDPYPEQCRQTAVALAGLLGVAPEGWTQVWQSRFGREPWLEPYADRAVPALARRHPRVVVACPGFTADCLETLDEIGEVLAADFRRAGGAELRLVPSLNAGADWVRALAELVRRSTQPRSTAEP